MHPIGVVRSPFHERSSAPRQATAPFAAAATIELFPGQNYEDALADVAAWDYLWLLFCFDRNRGWRPKVLPPRSAGKRRGVFATRSPYRPNPLGLSAVRLVRVEGLTLHVANADMLDGTPVLDLKPYVAYADALPQAGGGWMTPLVHDDPAAPTVDPEPGFVVQWTDLAATQAAWIQTYTSFDLHSAAERTLSLGPQPHAYRRIRPTPSGFRLAHKEWRLDFRVAGRIVTVMVVQSGYRPRELATDSDVPALQIHRAFVAQFGDSATP